MSVFKIKDKRENELLILFENEIQSNIVALDFFRRLSTIYGSERDS